MPRHCSHVRMADGVTAILCGSRATQAKCRVPGCTRPAERECDHPVTRKGKAGTCDLNLCALHATPAGPDLDHCPAHAKAAGGKP